MNLRKLSLASLILASIPIAAMAEDDFAAGAVGVSASANLEFRVAIPAFVYFRVGAAGGGVDIVLFDLLADNLEPGSGVNATDVPVGVELRANRSVEITAAPLAGSGPLAAGSTEITALSSTASIPVPAFGATTVPTGGPVDTTATWTFSYDNALSYAPGNYQTVVMYTATTL